VGGGLAGAFLPLAIYRLSVPYGEPPRASCERCGQRLAWAGIRCRGCRRDLGPQWWVSASAAFAGAGILTLSLPGGALAALAAVPLALLGTVLGLVDVACRRLPTAIVVPSTVVGAMALFAVSAGTGDWGSLGRAALGALTLGAIYLALYALPGGNLGFGDVQLAVLIGLLLGYLGWAQVLWGAMLPWLVNAPVVLALLASGRAGRRSRVPFGPSMIAGAVLSVALVTALAG